MTMIYITCFQNGFVYGNKSFTLKITADKVFGDEWILQYCYKSHSGRYICLIKKDKVVELINS